MDLSEINWDFNTAGLWPLQVKVVVILIVCSLVAGGGYYQFTMDQLTELDTLEVEEQTLITSFEGKQRKAVSLGDYRAQLKEIEGLLTGMMKQMPTKAEVANLLTEISQTAVNSGLEQKLFQPEAEEKKDFYVELPYSIEMAGKYEELGMFVGGLASLPRIVTVHDIDISIITEGVENKDNKEGVLLSMKATVKTYNEAVSEEKEDEQGTAK